MCVICLACPHQVPKRIDIYVDDEQPHSALNQPSQPTQGKLTFGDSSGRLFSLYSKAAKEEDDKMVERWQKDAEGILIFVSPGPWLPVRSAFGTNRKL